MTNKNRIITIYLAAATSVTGLAQTDTLSLGEIIVTATRPDAIVAADKIIYTPSASIQGSSGTIYETLSSLPGVSVDSKGSISVYGQNGVVMTVDGRRVILRGDALLNYLKTLPAERVEKIEIRSIPSAGQDASSAMTSIDIRLKRADDEGFNFSAGAQGRAWRIGSGHINLFGEYATGAHHLSASYFYRQAYNPSCLFTERPLPDSSHRLDQYYDRRRNDKLHNAGICYDIDIKKDMMAGMSLNANLFHRDENAVMSTSVPIAGEMTVTDNTTASKTRNIYGNAYFRIRRQDSDTSLDINFDFFNYHNDENQLMTDNNNSCIDGDMGGTTEGYVASADYRADITKAIYLLCGAKTSFININNGGAYTGNGSNTSGNPADLSSDFGYHENVNAAYAELRAKHCRVTASIGLRVEQTNASTVFSGNEAIEHTDYRRHDLKLFPSCSASMTFDTGDNIALSYARRVTRPRYTDLNPFIYIFDDITHVDGNIGLRAAITDNIHVAWGHRSWLRIALAGAYTTDAMVKCYREISERVVYVSPENLPHHLLGSLSAAAVNINPVASWHTSLTATLLYNYYKFPLSTGIPDNYRLTPVIDCKNRFDFGSGWSAEASVTLRGRTVYGQATVSGSQNVYLAVRKKFMDGNGAVTLFVSDLFDTCGRTSVISLDGRSAMLKEKEYEEMRLVGLSLSIRLHSGKSVRRNSGRDGMIDEIKRVNL